MNIEETLLNNHSDREYNYKDIVRSMAQYGEQQQKVYYELVAKQANEIDGLKSKIEKLVDTESRRIDWLYSAKEKLNVNQSVSFDRVLDHIVNEFNKGNIKFDNL